MDNFNKVLFDVSMVDYDEMQDVTTVRVSTTYGNADIATGQISYDESGKPTIVWTETRSHADFAPLDGEQLAKDVIAAIDAEREVFIDAETLRDLFDDVTPSGVTSPEGAGFKLIAKD